MKLGGQARVSDRFRSRAGCRRRAVLLDVLDLVLLLRVRLHLVGLVLGPGSDVGGVVSSVGVELSSRGEIHDVGADLRAAALVSLRDSRVIPTSLTLSMKSWE